MKKRIVSVVCVLLLLSLTVSGGLSAAADGDPYAVVPDEDPVRIVPDGIPMADGGAATAKSADAAAGAGGETDAVLPADGKLSPAFDVLAASQKMIKTGLSSSGVRFTFTDFCQSLGLSSFEKIVVTKAPDPADGKLTVGSMTVTDGQPIDASLLSMMEFRPASPQVERASFSFRGDESSSGAELVCTLKLIDRVNYAPVFSDGAGNPFSVSASVGGTVTGSLPASDPEGDALFFEITAYPAHGSLILSDSETGTFSYRVSDGYRGTDSFSYVAYDCYGNCTPEREVRLTVSSDR